MDNLLFDIGIDRAVTRDLEEITKLVQTVRGDTHDMNASQFVVARDGDKLVGCVRLKDLQNNVFELASLVVLEQYRGQNIGKSLLEKLLKQNKTRPVYLLCFADRKGFYDKCGFVDVDPTNLPEVLKIEYNRVLEVLKEQNKQIISMVYN